MIVDEIRWDIDGFSIKDLKKFLNKFKDSDKIDIDYEYNCCDGCTVKINVEREEN